MISEREFLRRVIRTVPTLSAAVVLLAALLTAIYVAVAILPCRAIFLTQ